MNGYTVRIELIGHTSAVGVEIDARGFGEDWWDEHSGWDLRRIGGAVALRLLKGMRAHAAGWRAEIYLRSPSGCETLWARGEEQVDHLAARLVAEYLSTGDEATLAVLHDWLLDSFGFGFS